MTQAWTPDGPISLPPRTLAYGAGAVIAAMALVGIGLGFNASSRRSSAPGLEGSGQAASADGAPIARPIVELPPPVTAANTDADAAASNATDAAADNIDAQTAAAQAVQSKPSKAPADIDQILTSKTEKPPTSVKPSTDEAPPVKTDVPF